MESDLFSYKYASISSFVFFDVETPMSESRMFVCRICGKRFKTEMNTYNHVEGYHTGEWVSKRDSLILEKY